MCKDSSIKFRISKEEKNELIKLAKKYNMTLTEFILTMVEKGVNQEIRELLS